MIEAEGGNNILMLKSLKFFLTLYLFWNWISVYLEFSIKTDRVPKLRKSTKLLSPGGVLRKWTVLFCTTGWGVGRSRWPFVPFSSWKCLVFTTISEVRRWSSFTSWRLWWKSSTRLVSKRVILVEFSVLARLAIFHLILVYFCWLGSFLILTWF